MDEQWRPVVGYEGTYEVSTLGRVRSLPRRYLRARAGIVSPWISKTQGYVMIALSSGGRRKTFRVHTLVAAAFLGPRPEGQDVRHLDGDRSNPVLDNLAYGTRSQNLYDAVAHGTHHNAKKTHCIYGHPFSPENTYVWGRQRMCKTCHRRHANNNNQKRRYRKAS